MEFWHAEYADSLYLRNLRDLRGKDRVFWHAEYADCFAHRAQRPHPTTRPLQLGTVSTPTVAEAYTRITKTKINCAIHLRNKIKVRIFAKAKSKKL